MAPGNCGALLTFHNGAKLNLSSGIASCCVVYGDKYCKYSRRSGGEMVIDICFYAPRSIEG